MDFEAKMEIPRTTRTEVLVCNWQGPTSTKYNFIYITHHVITGIFFFFDKMIKPFDKA